MNNDHFVQVFDALPEGSMRFLFPHGLNPSFLDSVKGNRPAKNAYVAHLVSTRSYDDNRDFVTIHTPTIQQAIGGAAWHDARRIFMPYLEIHHSYQTGNRSKGYRWIESFRNQDCVGYIIRCPNFKRHLVSVSHKHLVKLGQVAHEVHRNLLLIGCDITDIPGFLNALPDKPGAKSEAHRRAVIGASIYQIHDKSYGGISMDANHRMHHALTRTPRTVRAHLSLADEETVELDLANSQPYFLASKFRKVPSLAGSVCEGRFYEDINQHLLSPYDLHDSEDKCELKRQCLMRIYARPINGYEWYVKPDSRAVMIATAMNAAFPGLPACIDQYRLQYGDTALANAMQKLESSVFIDTALPELQGRGIPAIPIHDSILCRKSHADHVARCLEKELLRATGLRPVLRVGGK